MANSTDPFGKQVFGGATSIPGGTSSAAAPTAAAGPPMPWKSFNQYFTDKGQLSEAQKYGAYRSSYLPGTGTDQQKWGPSGNPYRFAEEYNQYKTTLPQQYQDLMNYGISPEQVQSGQVKSIMRGNGLEQIQMPVAAGAAPGSAGAYGVGGGSTNSLSPDVLKKMWR